MLAERHEFHGPKICFSMSLSSLDCTSFCELNNYSRMMLFITPIWPSRIWLLSSKAMLIGGCVYSGYRQSSPAVFVWCVIGWFQMIFVICHVYLLQTDRPSPGNADRVLSLRSTQILGSVVSVVGTDVCDGWEVTTLVSCKRSLKHKCRLTRCSDSATLSRCVKTGAIVSQLPGAHVLSCLPGSFSNCQDENQSCCCLWRLM